MRIKLGQSAIEFLKWAKEHGPNFDNLVAAWIARNPGRFNADGSPTNGGKANASAEGSLKVEFQRVRRAINEALKTAGDSRACTPETFPALFPTGLRQRRGGGEVEVDLDDLMG